MKITLIIILLNWNPVVTINSASTVGSVAVCNTNGASAYTLPPTKVRIPMPDLKSCLEARHQIDDYSMLVAAACSAE
jgi:hypothetical protein